MCGDVGTEGARLTWADREDAARRPRTRLAAARGGSPRPADGPKPRRVRWAKKTSFSYVIHMEMEVTAAHLKAQLQAQLVLERLGAGGFQAHHRDQRREAV